MSLIRNLYGRNICFYYYGEDHLVVNLYKYIKNNLEKNNYVYLYINEDVNKILMRSLTDNEKDMVESISLDDLILRKTPVSEKDTSNIIGSLKKKALDMGFWNVTIIIDASRLIRNLHELLFEDFISKMTLMCKTDKLNILTCYDFVDYTNREKIITDKVMKLSYQYHNYRMFSNEIIPIENFVLHNNENEEPATIN